ncbi:MAG TPA: hypothetical protein VGB85_32700, partial [Nannocystis sp.]
MTQRTRGSRWGLVAVALAWSVHAEAVAQEARPADKPAERSARPSVRVPARNPAGAAKALAALARFASGQLTESPYDRRVAAALDRLPGAKATAARIVAAYTSMTPDDRGVVFPGVAPDQLLTRGFDRVGFDRWRAAHAEANAAKLGARTTLPPDPADGKNRAQYELVYRGMKVHKGADADGTDEPVVFTAVFTPGGPTEPYRAVARTLPDSGTLGVANGASSGASAGEVWSSPSFPGGWNSGLVIVTAVIEDNGDLAQRKEDLNLLLALAKSEASEDNNPDRMLVLRRELEDTLELLHLADRQTWDANAVQVRLLTASEYDALSTQAAQASPFPHKLKIDHAPRGGEYTLYFDVPKPQSPRKTVQITIKQLEALGPERDRFENQQADFGVDVSASASTQAGVSRTFARNKNVLKAGWTVERQVQAGGNVAISLRLWDRDPPPRTACTSQAGWPHALCHSYCAATPVACTPNQANQNHCPAYDGACPDAQLDYD